MNEKIDLRIQKTYLALHNAFTELLEKKRFDDFTVNELCEHAMIRRTTFYKHFEDKYDYFIFYLKETAEEIRNDFTSDVPQNEIHTHIFEMTRGLLRFINIKRNFVNNIMHSKAFPLLFDMLTDLVKSEILCQPNHQTECFNGDLEGIAAFYAGGLLTTLRYYYQQNELNDEEKIMQTLSNFVPKRIY